MENVDNSNIEIKKVNNNNGFKYIFLIIIFLGIGFGLGTYYTKKYLDKDDDGKREINRVDDNGKTDITNDEKYTKIIDSVYTIVNGKAMFYDSRGITYTELDNNTKLKYLYDYVVANEKSTSETWNYIMQGYCNNNFVVDPPMSASLPSLVCTVSRIKKSDLNEASMKMFNDNTLKLDNNFNPVSNKSCVVDGESYVCGNITSTNTITGSIETKFTIQKVLLDKDKTIEIYEKGYLIDKRSNVDDPNDEYDNYYLHSVDSKNYYYELKSADNLTFKHIFKINEDNNYYYVGTELVE